MSLNHIRLYKKFSIRPSLTVVCLIAAILVALPGVSGVSKVTAGEVANRSDSPDRPMGEFVRDISIPEMELQFPKIQRIPLGDRGELLALNSDFFPLAQVEIHFYAGEFQDLPAETGALLTGAWKLGGSKSLPGSQFMQRLEFLGAKLVVSGSFEKTVVQISYLVRDQAEIFRLLEEWLLTPILTEENVETVRGQAKEALLRRNDSVASLGMRKTKEYAYQGHLRSRSESLSSLAKVTRENMLAYHSRIIGSPSVKVLHSGDGKPEEIARWVQNVLDRTKVFKPIPYSDIDYSQWKERFSRKPNDIVLVEKETNQSIVILTGTMPSHNHPDFYAIQVLNYILGGGGFNAYFMTEIRNNKGLAYSTTSHIVFEKTHGLFLAYTLTKNDSVPEVLNLMEDILSSKTVDKIRKDELIRAQNAIVNQFVFLFENKQKILANQIRFEDHDMPENYLEIYRDKIQSVTLVDLRRVGREYFQPEKLRVVVTGPRSLELGLGSTTGRKVLVVAPEEVFP